jgi:hypothetical protein
MKCNDEDKPREKQHYKGTDNGKKAFFHGGPSTAGTISRVRWYRHKPVTPFPAGL